MGSRLKLLFILCFTVWVAFNFLDVPLTVQAETYYRTIESESGDGYLDARYATYSTCHDFASANSSYTSSSSARVGQRNDTLYYIYRSYLYFSTSVIPDDATITSATISLYILDNATLTPFNVTIQSGQPTYPHSPLQTSDYYYNYYDPNGQGGSRNTSDLCYNNAWWNITLNATGLAWISKTTTTKLTIRSSLDIYGTAPSQTTEYIEFRTSEGGYPARLYIEYEATVGASYVLRGAYNEDGFRAGAINVTVYPETEAPETYELDGMELVSLESTPVNFAFDLGYNQTRIFYIRETFEEIYVIIPDDPYYTYYFSIVDFIGVQNGYLETLINLNGTDQVVERWQLDVVNELPFTLTWGRTYKVRLVCDLGVYYYPEVVAGAETTITFSISPDMFPRIPSDTSQVTVSATRYGVSWIQGIYSDANQTTSWIYFAIYDVDNTTAPVYYTNASAYTLTVNWYEGDPTSHYYAYFQSYESVRGTLEWWIPCPLPRAEATPWDDLQTILGTGFPFDIDQAVPAAIVLLVFAAFSWKNAGVGLVVGVLFAAFLAWMGWFAIGWDWLTTSLAMAVLIAFSIQKDREPQL